MGEIDSPRSIWSDINDILTHHPGKTPIDFEVRRSKAKVTGQACVQICFWIMNISSQNQ